MKQSPKYKKLIIAFLLLVAAGMFAFIAHSLNEVTWLTGNDRIIYYTVIFVIAVLVFIADGRYTIPELAVITAMLAGLMLIRICLLYMITWDYKDFLNPWVEEMRGLSAREAISGYKGNYNLPYIYLIFLISRYSGYDLMIIKAFSSLFDVVLAYYVMKCVSLKYHGKYMQAAAFVLTLAIPTVFYNSSAWGQCDAVYVAFCIGMLYYGISGQSKKAVIAWTLGFAFKLQSVFALPIMLLLMTKKKIKWKDMIFIPITYFIIMIPALLCGKSFMSCLSVYYNQLGDVSVLSCGAQNIWLLVKDAPFPPYNKLAVYLAGTATVFFTGICYVKRDRLDTDNMIHAFLCISLLLPFLLPQMHDRYFYMADIASLLYFFYDRKKFYVPLIVVYSSFNSYRNYLNIGDFGKDVYISFVLLFLIAKLINDLFIKLKPLPEPETKGAMNP